MFVEPPELAPDLEWMLQSGQVGSATIIAALAEELYPGAYGLAYALLGESRPAQAVTLQAFAAAAAERHHYRAGWGVQAWVYRMVVRACRAAGSRKAAFPDGQTGWLAELARLPEAERAALYLQTCDLDDNGCAYALDLRPGAWLRLAARARQKFHLEPLPGRLSWLDAAPPPPLEAGESAGWVEQAVTLAAAREKRRPLSVLGREVAFLAVLLLALAGGWWWLDRLNDRTAAPRPTATTKVVYITATVEAAQYPTATPPVSSRVQRTLTIADAPVQAASFISDTLEISATLDMTYTAGWQQSGALGLAGVLNYWGLNRRPEQIVRFLQPNPGDQTVMPYELLAYVDTYTPYRAVYRLDGSTDLLARLAGEGFPVLLQRFDAPAAGADWVGRYEVIAGFNRRDYLALDVWMPYQPEGGRFRMPGYAFSKGWLPFNNAYLVIYPPEREDDVSRLLGSDFNEDANLQKAFNDGGVSVYTQGSPLLEFYAWFNYGMSMTYLDDYTNAAMAFDEAYRIFNASNTGFPLGQMLVYQSRPYWAYYYSGRYADLEALASATLKEIAGTPPEESLYWRALARDALGNRAGALDDLRQALKLNPNFEAGQYQFERISGAG